VYQGIITEPSTQIHFYPRSALTDGEVTACRDWLTDGYTTHWFKTKRSFATRSTS